MNRSRSRGGGSGPSRTLRVPDPTLLLVTELALCSRPGAALLSFSWTFPTKNTPSSPSKSARQEWATSSLMHPVDGFDLEGDVAVENVGHRTGNGHLRAPVDIALTVGQPSASGGSRRGSSGPHVGSARAPTHVNWPSLSSRGLCPSPSPAVTEVGVARTPIRRAGAKPR
jgi:hypothetical protein